MIHHILHRIWNCRRSNLWIWGLLAVVILLMWYAVDIVFNYESAAHSPMGYNLDGTYYIELKYKHNVGNVTEDEAQIRKSLINLCKEYPGVEAVCCALGTMPLSEGRMFEGYSTHDDSSRIVSTYIRYGNPEMFDVFRLEPIYGAVDRDGWSVAEYPMPAVLTEDLADSLFQDASKAVGQTFFNPYYWKAGEATDYRVAAVVPMQKFGEYERYEPMILLPLEPSREENARIILRVRPDARVGFIDRFVDDMTPILDRGVFYLKRVQSLDDLKSTYAMLQGTSSYLNMTYGVICFFLFTVFLIVFGTFSIRTRRTRAEIGLKVAMGSSRRLIMAELVLEGIILLVLAAVPAILIAAYMAYSEVTVNTLTDMTVGRFIVCFVGALVLLSVVIVLAIWPSTAGAMKLSPAVALRDE
ncbi:MAG: ABC transporter permease [Muribaculum sp.]|nr:ABC transporter permease [Muribaculum sp.]